ncbi:hypothetical protein VTO42DRAFT_2893 [Malbranchea cinnamomea]
MESRILLSKLRFDFFNGFNANWLAIPVGLLLVVFVKRRYLTSIRDIPGPFAASFSRAWLVYHGIKGHTEEATIEEHRKHGTFVRIADNEVSVRHPDALKLILQANLRKPVWYEIFSFPDYRYVNQMSECDPHRHIEKGRNITPGYSLSNIIKSEPYVDALIDLLERRFDEHSAAGEPIDPEKWFEFVAFDILGEVMFSQPFKFVEKGEDIGNAIANTRVLAMYVSVVGHFVWFHNLTMGNPLASYLGLQPSSYLLDFSKKAIEARRRNPDIRRDMIGMWFDNLYKNPDKMQESEIMAATNANVSAGADTVSATLQALFYNLLRHPQYLQRVRDELDAAQARGELSPVVQYSEAKNLTFLQACIKETYRFHPATGLGIPRLVPDGGLTIAGRHFTKGTILSVNPWVHHRIPEIFGEDCDTFNPERWLDPERYRIMNRNLIHWSAGYNQCPGRHLAQFEISKIAATLLRDFDIEQVDPKKPWRFETYFNCVPYGWPCYVKRRRTPQSE